MDGHGRGGKGVCPVFGAPRPLSRILLLFKVLVEDQMGKDVMGSERRRGRDQSGLLPTERFSSTAVFDVINQGKLRQSHFLSLV